MSAGGADATERVPPGGVLPFELALDLTGMEGRITKTASVMFDDGTVETMVVEADVRTRLKLAPSDAAFGVIESKDIARTIVAGGAKAGSVSLNKDGTVNKQKVTLGVEVR